MTVTRTVVPGDWYGVLGDDVIVLLPPDAKSRVAGLWERVDEGAGFDVVLDALISEGLRSLTGFVLVSGEGRDVKIVIRGAGEAVLDTSDGQVTVTGSADTTWVEQNVSGVSALRVRVAEGSGPAYAVGPGLVRVAGVEHPAARPASAPAVAPETAAEPAPEMAPASAPEPVPEVPGEPPARILPPDPQLQPPEPPERPARILPPDPQLSPPVTPAFDPLTSPDLAVTPGVPSGAEYADDTGDTRAGPLDPGVLAGPEATAAAPAGAVARLIFSSGEVVDVDRAIVIGRAPDHGRYAGDGQTRLVTVPSPHQEISSTHLEIRPGTGADHGSAVATDLGSTNGTVVAEPGLPAEDLRPGIAVQLAPGATIDLGEGVTIQVTRA